MTTLSPVQMTTLFQALADATRRQMLLMLAEGEKTISELAEPFDISLVAASKHIKTLEKAGLLRREIKWRTHHCRIEPGPLAEAYEWLGFYEKFWTGRVDALERLLIEDELARSRNQGEDR